MKTIHAPLKLNYCLKIDETDLFLVKTTNICQHGGSTVDGVPITWCGDKNTPQK